MDYLQKYLEKFESNGQQEFASSIRKTASEVGDKYLNSFDFSSNQIGLLFGNVQSGKTGHVFGIACEAANKGFPFFLMLTTDNTLLQEQTYKRAKIDLSGFIICSENDEQKFRDHGEKPVIIVVKKNTRILKAWADRFRNSRLLEGNALFIIDDEADTASLNTKINNNRQSTINRYITNIRDSALCSMYLQVTGTPQSLLLQTQQSDWHPAFTYYFKPGKGYLGGDFFFPENQVPHFVHFIDDQTPIDNAKQVVLRHLVVSAQILLSGGNVSNCLVHPGIKQSAHQRAKENIEKGIAWWSYHHTDEKFERLFDDEYQSIEPSKYNKMDHNAIKTKVLEMLEKKDFSIVILNGTSNDNESNYQTGCNFIVGGTNLGRGVTFAQLNTFYYTRTSKSPQADTMWQHSRMFGYDRDPGLVTMYSSRELYSLFASINETNNSIIKQAEHKQKITIAYPDNLNPTRGSVLDKSLLNILVGGSNHFPVNPKNNTLTQISNMVQKFSDNSSAVPVSLHFVDELLKHFQAEESFNLKGYISMIEAAYAKSSLKQGYLLVRRNRDITRGTRALLSPNDWKESNKYEDSFVISLYQVIGQKEKGWSGEPVWVPNIKLPKSKNFYII
ncbi:helicase [Oenococcus oeni IOEB_C23]|uniref:Z1 domain-containing protein n=1 Tax=Oenococcus oeni TaxID=1247 RepID=UPI00050F88AE|nr:Z1 domain-containing protein [Oenococcus oeni]KGH67051.1 helicase [Oenococcus oeni IOEB_C23]